MKAGWTITREATTMAADVLVVGGGCAGCSAAVAAARTGAEVLLLERSGILGGISTGVLDTFYGFYAPRTSSRVVGGLPWEVAERLLGAGHAFERPNTYGAGTGVTYNPHRLAVLWDDLLHRSGCSVSLHTAVVDVVREGDGVTEVLAISGSELLRVRPRVVVDASGDGVVAHLAGAAAETFADIERPQAMTATFSMAPVDQSALREFGRDALLDRLSTHAQAYGLPRKEGSLHPTPAPGVEFVHMTRVTDHDPRHPDELSAAERAGRRQITGYAAFLRDHVPGFDQAEIVWMSRHLGIRESRRVRCRYWLERADIVEGRCFPDGVVQGAAPIEVHAGADTRWEFLDRGVYEIPLRCLVVANLRNVLVAGRCFSASHDAHASARNMAQCMGMGEAAGVCAALGADDGSGEDVPAAAVRAELAERGALLGGEMR